MMPKAVPPGAAVTPPLLPQTPGVPAEPVPRAERFGLAHAAVAAALVAAALIVLPRWREIFIVLAMLAAVIPFHLLPAVLWARTVGVKVEVIGWLFGAWVARFRVRDIPIRINWIPLGGYVKLAGDRERHPPHVRVYDELPRWQQAGMNLAMPLGTLLLAAALLGPTAAVNSFTRGYRQLYEAALDPGTLGRAFNAFLARSPAANGVTRSARSRRRTRRSTCCRSRSSTAGSR
jgi:hypothetical protein